MSAPPLLDDDFRSVLATVDKQGRRRHPQVLIVGGFWRRWRNAVAIVLVSFYLALPFIHINGLPLLRIDIPHRHYIIAGQVFWPQDFFYALLFLLIAVALTILTVALVGRFFCGWLCPHQIFLELVYRPIEQWIRGTPARQNADKKSGKGSLRRVITWLIFIVISGALANTATALFIGTDGYLAGIVVNPVAHPTAAIFFTVLFIIILFNFGWLREQTCTLICPYGRLQSVLLDSHSLSVSYDTARGEPRGKAGKTTGDCVDCLRCVAVCPTGIDIRNGNQLECINCTACIDACADVMNRLGRAPGLIRYASEVGLAGGKRLLVRPRTVLYTVFTVLLIVIATYHLSHRHALVASRLRTSAHPVLIDDHGRTMVRQVVPCALLNRSHEPLSCQLLLPATLQATIIVAQSPIVLPPDQRTELAPVIDVPRSVLTGPSLDTVLSITSTSGERIDLPITLFAP